VRLCIATCSHQLNPAQAGKRTRPCRAPRRALRLVFYSFFAVSASVGALIATTQVVAALNHAPSALPLQDVAQSLAIDLGAVATFAVLFRSDYKVLAAAGTCC